MISLLATPTGANNVTAWFGFPSSILLFISAPDVLKTAVTGLVAVSLDEEVLNIVLVLVVFVLVMGCPNHDEVIWCESALSFFAASRHVLVTSVRNILLDSTEADINSATSVTYLGTAFERAGLGADLWSHLSYHEQYLVVVA